MTTQTVRTVGMWRRRLVYRLLGLDWGARVLIDGCTATVWAENNPNDVTEFLEFRERQPTYMTDPNDPSDGPR